MNGDEIKRRRAQKAVLAGGERALKEARAAMKKVQSSLQKSKVSQKQRKKKGADNLKFAL